MVRYLGPYQTVCDDWNYWWTYLADHLSQPTRFGFAQRALLNLGAPSGGGVGQQGATTPVNGTSGSDSPPLTVFGGQQFLHAQSYGAAIDDQGNADCETGQRGYPKKLNSFDPEGRNLAVDPHTPGDQGPTFHGRTRVPRARRSAVTPDRPPAPDDRERPMTRAGAAQRHQRVRGRRDRDRRDRRVHVPRVHEVRQPVRQPSLSTRRSPAPAGCARDRWCGSPASTSARSGIGQVPGLPRPARAGRAARPPRSR